MPVSTRYLSVTDLLGPLEKFQTREFEYRSEVFPPFELLQQATINAARVIGMAGEIGEISSGAYADLLVVDGNPLEDLSLLQSDGANLQIIMKGGEVVPKSPRFARSCARFNSVGCATLTPFTRYKETTEVEI